MDDARPREWCMFSPRPDQLCLHPAMPGKNRCRYHGGVNMRQRSYMLEVRRLESVLLFQPSLPFTMSPARYDYVSDYVDLADLEKFAEWRAEWLRRIAASEPPRQVIAGVCFSPYAYQVDRHDRAVRIDMTTGQTIEVAPLNTAMRYPEYGRRARYGAMYR